jgi:hypothetical protein
MSTSKIGSHKNARKRTAISEGANEVGAVVIPIFYLGIVERKRKTPEGVFLAVYLRGIHKEHTSAKNEGALKSKN